MPPSTSSNDPEHDADPYTPYALADSYTHSYGGLHLRKRATRLVITPGGFLQHRPASYAPQPFGALLAAGAGADVSPAAGPPDTSADFRSAAQELLSSPLAAAELHTVGIAQEDNDESPPLRFETPEPFLGDHDEPNRPLRPAAQPSAHNHQEHDNDAANPPDVKVILSSEAPSPSPFVQGTQRRATSSPACTSTPPAFTIHPTLVSTPLASSAVLPTSEASSVPLQSSISLLPTAVVANTSTGDPFGISPAAAGTAGPVAFSALHTVPFYVSVVFGSIAGAALLAALVAWAFRFRSSARMRREERIFNCPGNAGIAGDDGDGDGGGWAAWWSRPFMNRVGSGRESLATIETRSVANYVSAPLHGGGGGGAGGAVNEGVWREWEEATGMSFGRAMGVGSGTDMAMRRTVSSKRRHQARAANAGEFGDSSQADLDIPQRSGSYYVHPPPQTYDAPTQPLENPFAPTQRYPPAARPSGLALERSGTRDSARSVGRGRGGLPRMDSLGSGVGLGLDLSADGGAGGMLRVTNRAEGDGMSVTTASRANTALGMNDDRFSPSASLSPTPPASAEASVFAARSSATLSSMGGAGAPSTLPLPSFPSFPSVLNAIRTRFSAAFSPGQAQAQVEEDRFTSAPERCGVKKARQWTNTGVDASPEEEEKGGKGGKEKAATRPLSVPKKRSRRYSAGPSSHGNSNAARRLSSMRGISAKRVREAFPVGLSRKRGSRVDMRRLASSASCASRSGGTSRMGGGGSARRSRGWEDLEARSEYGFEEEEGEEEEGEGDSVRDYAGGGDDAGEGRPRFLRRPSVASYLSSVSGVSAFSVNSSREELVTEREAEARGVLAERRA
ncbi:hypothetical protein BDN71DRAFT_1456262 [Pleurotus eryngii]|uniref:Uncharacterized protein n=1 Tax=Pleurotus eryngii TaxID=5323 RepID=A0A9P6DB51_PLEER|nr:hypothetical protein BDN71DRAFT_1456262 [Pleurotus eryngii]